MITFIEGMLVEKTPARVVINIGGLGYEVCIPLSSYERLPKEQQVCRLLTVDHVREDKHILFGFVTDAERVIFVKLLGVSGIGPKLALSALSSLSVREITESVVAGEVGRLSSISGVGKKIAERMIIELREQFSEDAVFNSGTSVSKDMIHEQCVQDAVHALISLGYKPGNARRMVFSVLPKPLNDISVEDIVRKALNR